MFESAYILKLTAYALKCDHIDHGYYNAGNRFQSFLIRISSKNE